MTQPHDFFLKCQEYGLTIERCEGSILTLSKKFPAGSTLGFATAETDGSIIYEAPGKGGSVWGTTGDGIGGMVAINTGVFRINKSGVQKRWLAQLSKLL